jgi:hypothetical protein
MLAPPLCVTPSKSFRVGDLHGMTPSLKEISCGQLAITVIALAILGTSKVAHAQSSDLDQPTIVFSAFLYAPPADDAIVANVAHVLKPGGSFLIPRRTATSCGTGIATTSAIIAPCSSATCCHRCFRDMSIDYAVNHARWARTMARALRARVAQRPHVQAVPQLAEEIAPGVRAHWAVLDAQICCLEQRPEVRCA